MRVFADVTVTAAHVALMFLGLDSVSTIKTNETLLFLKLQHPMVRLIKIKMTIATDTIYEDLVLRAVNFGNDLHVWKHGMRSTPAQPYA